MKALKLMFRLHTETTSVYALHYVGNGLSILLPVPNIISPQCSIQIRFYSTTVAQNPHINSIYVERK